MNQSSNLGSNPHCGRIALVGPMGSGKTTVGQRLAAALGRPFVDLDAWIVAHAGLSIPEIFAKQGEMAFRRLELEALVSVAQDDALCGCVCATGGGVVETAACRAQLSRDWTVIELRATVATLAAHLAGETAGRPMFRDAVSVERRILELYERRKSLYDEVAQFRVSIDGRTPEEVVHVIARHLQEGCDAASMDA
jgi:shikimate kinase